jgi:hypothetical protein
MTFCALPCLYVTTAYLATSATQHAYDLLIYLLVLTDPSSKQNISNLTCLAGNKQVKLPKILSGQVPRVAKWVTYDSRLTLRYHSYFHKSNPHMEYGSRYIMQPLCQIQMKSDYNHRSLFE